MNPPIRILLVDDHGFTRRGLRAFLEREFKGSMIGEAPSAEVAYECLRETAADVVIMDLGLPGDDGIVATEQVRATWPGTKVLILTGKSCESDGDNDVRRALLAGADGFVSKADGDDCVIRAIEALSKGHAFLSPKSAAELIRTLRADAAVRTDALRLSPQETAVLKRLAEGASYKDIAAELGIGVRTVDTHRTHLAQKLGGASREDLVRQARRLGLTSP